MKKIFSPALLLIAFVANAQEKNMNKSFEGIDRLELNVSSGDIDLSKSSSNTVTVDLSYTYDDDSYNPSFEQRGSVLVIKEKFKKGSYSGSSTWTIEIPNGIETSVNTGSGDLKVEDLTVDIRSNGGSGDIELSNVKGETRINTGSGSVDIENFDGEISVNVGSGDVTTNNSRGEISVNSGSGSIDLNNCNGDFGINAGSGDIEAENITVTGNSSFNVGSGDAEVSLAAGLDYDISVSSGSGDALVDFNGNKIVGNVIMKVKKDRGQISAPFKFDKEEEEGNGKDTYVVKTAKFGSKDIDIKISSGSGKAQVRE